MAEHADSQRHAAEAQVSTGQQLAPARHAHQELANHSHNAKQLQAQSLAMKASQQAVQMHALRQLLGSNHVQNAPRIVRENPNKPTLQAKSGVFVGGAPIQLRDTKISHEFSTYGGAVGTTSTGAVIAKEAVGLHMHAVLMPEKPIVGSEPPKDNSPMYSSLWASNGIVRGHLLNHDLGGHGAPENLFPITSGANSRHSKEVEGPVKDQLHLAKAETDKGNEQSVMYDVNVISNSNAASGFACTWERRDDKDAKIAGGSANIESDFVLDTKADPWSGSGAGVKTKGWAHEKGTKFSIDEFKNDIKLGKIEKKEIKDHKGGAVGASAAAGDKVRVAIDTAQAAFLTTWLGSARMQRQLERLSPAESDDLQATIETELEDINDGLYELLVNQDFVWDQEILVGMFAKRFI